MARINLREHYPQYELDCFIEVPVNDADAFIASMAEDIAAVYFGFQRAENAHQRRVYYHKAHYSLNAGDGIENDAIDAAPSPEALFMEKGTREELSAALATLPETQRRRIVAHCIHGINNYAIARAEGVDESAVRASINRGLQAMKKYLKNLL